MIYSKALSKLLRITLGKPERHITVNDECLHIIYEGEFSKEDIDELRNIDIWFQKNGNPPLIANFLPDDVRPKGIKKM